jgi:DNA repair exonuclease SbcCD ATPase subunit
MQLAFIALAAAVVAIILWLASLTKAKALNARVNSLLVENASLAEAQKSLSEQQRKSAKLLETRTEEVTELKKEIGALKKKNFSLQEDAKKSKTSYEAKLEEREKAMVARPAFEEALPRAKPVKAEPSQAAPVPAPTPAPAPAVSADAELAKKLDHLVKDNSELIATVAELKNDLRNTSADMRRMKKRVDDYRRADLVTKNRTDLLADKLGTMGRQYYDAISELAALKGEVKPPVPRDVAYADEQAATVAAQDAQPAPHHDDEVSALSQAVVATMQRDVN